MNPVGFPHIAPRQQHPLAPYEGISLAASRIAEIACHVFAIMACFTIFEPPAALIASLFSVALIRTLFYSLSERRGPGGVFPFGQQDPHVIIIQQPQHQAWYQRAFNWFPPMPRWHGPTWRAPVNVPQNFGPQPGGVVRTQAGLRRSAQPTHEEAPRRAVGHAAMTTQAFGPQPGIASRYQQQTAYPTRRTVGTRGSS